MSDHPVIRAITYSGLYVGAVIGAGFASGQEVLQFFSSYGMVGILSAVIIIFALMWYGTVFMELGYHLNTNNQRDILQYLCGRYFGTAFDYILLFFMFGFVAIMISGGGAAVEQYFGISSLYGRLLIAAAAFATVYFGFMSAANTLGIASPIMVVGILAIGIITIVLHADGLADVATNVEELQPATASAYWWTSAILYMSYNIVTGVGTFSSIGKTERRLGVVRGAGLIGGAALGLSLLLVVVALLANLKDVVTYEVPFLQIAQQLGGVIGLLFAILLLMAIFTTAVSNLYGFCIRLGDTGSTRYRAICIAATVLAFIASIVPFSRLIGLLYPLFGLLGLIVMLAALYKSMTGRVFMAADKGAVVAQASGGS